MNGVGSTMVEWEYDPENENELIDSWLTEVLWYFRPVTEEELQNALCIYPRIKR
jgi:hypothetical protein